MSEYPLSSRSPAPVIAVFKHFAGGLVQGPVTSLSGCMTLAVVCARPVSRYLHEAVIQAEVVPYTVLPALPVLPVVGESVHDELVDPGERQPSLRRRVDRHRDQGDVGVRWLFMMRRNLIADRRSRQDWPGCQRRLIEGRPGERVGTQHFRDQASESVRTFYGEHFVNWKDVPVFSSTQITGLILRIREETMNLRTTALLHREYFLKGLKWKTRRLQVVKVSGDFQYHSLCFCVILSFSRTMETVPSGCSVATHLTSREIEITSRSYRLFLSRDGNWKAPLNFTVYSRGRNGVADV